MTWRFLQNTVSENAVKLSDIVTVDNLLAVSKKRGYRVFEDYRKPLNLNIWVVRSNNQEAGKFDDIQIVFWKDVDRWNVHKFSCTADPSDHYLLNPINPKGTAIVKPDQYRGVWKLGLHKGRANHPALVQNSAITVIRDFNRDAILDYKVPTNLYRKHKETTANNNAGLTTKWYNEDGILIHIEDTGYFGINNHRAHRNIIKDYVGNYSAGCIVQNDPHRYHDEFIPMIEESIPHWGNAFTLTLITEETLRNAIRHI